MYAFVARGRDQDTIQNEISRMRSSRIESLDASIPKFAERVTSHQWVIAKVDRPR
jgi:hypothetical protein